MGESSPFKLLTSIMSDHTNKLIRPYINTPLADQLANREFDSDDVVLFALIVTLIVEIERKAHLFVNYNRDILSATAPSHTPTPFILVDTDLGQTTDCYGYTYKGSMVVCNGLGVAQAISQWAQVCDELQHCREVINGAVRAENPFRKFII